MKTIIGALVLTLSLTAFADHHEEKDKMGHDKEHQHVKTEVKDHEHDETHHKDDAHKDHKMESKMGSKMKAKKK